MEKYFMHRIQKENGVFSKGIEVHDTLDAAKLSFWGRMKLAYGNKAGITFVHCMITDGNGKIVPPYNRAWKADSETENKFFLHHIRLDNNTFDKAIDDLSLFETACGDFGEQMEYGYGNSKFPNVTFVHCMITDLLSGGMVMDPFDEVWIKQTETAPVDNSTEPDPFE